MEKRKRKRVERIGALIKILSDQPNRIITLNYFCDLFGAAKSSISEDIVIAKQLLEELQLGTLRTVAGAAGGVKFLPSISKGEATAFLGQLAETLSTPSRILPGGFLYMADVLYDPKILNPLGLIFATFFRGKNPEVVVTIETKGIPLALATAEALGISTVVVRHGNKVTEGSSVSINYISGSSKKIQTMSLAKRALEPGKKVLIIDDFIKAGGTVKGIISLMQEFEAEVVGLGILMEDMLWKAPRLVNNYLALLQFGDPQSEKNIIRFKTPL